MARWGVREVLMTMYGIVWSAAVLIIVWRTQDLRDIPNGLLAALGVGEGALLAAFRADAYVSGRNPGPKAPGPTPAEDTAP